MEELRTKLPCHVIISGPTNCGKTHLVDKLRSPFKQAFEYIILICPTYINNKTYRGFANNDKRCFVASPDPSNSDELNQILTDCEILFSERETLIILDDCTSSHEVKQRSNKFKSLAFSGRHQGLSV